MITQVIAKIYVNSLTKEERREIIGFISAEKSSDLKKAYIKYLAVNSNDRKKKIGTNLINSLVTDLQLDGFSEIDVEFASNNEAANAFFTKCGWEKTKTNNMLQFKKCLESKINIIINEL